jgi:integrase
MTRRHEGHIRKRNGSWEIRYSLGADALTGKRRTVTATVKGTEADAKRELRRRLHTVDEGAHVDPSRATVADFIERWLTDWASVNVSPKTAERYSELLRKHVRPHLGSLPVQKLRPLHLSELYTKLLREGRPLAPRTVGHVHRVLHRALGHALQWGVVNVNAASTVSPPPVASEEVQILSPAVQQTAIEALRGRAIFPVAVTALGTGMRRGELLALRWRDVDLERGIARVERSLEETRAGLRFKAPKTKHGRRNIALPAFTVAALREHWKAQQETRLRLGAGKSPPDSLVFATFEGEPRSPSSLTKDWSRVAAALGLGITFHALRHTHASSLIASGLDVLTISRRLGHGSPTITLGVYGHLFTNTDDKAAQALDVAFSSKP